MQIQMRNGDAAIDIDEEVAMCSHMCVYLAMFLCVGLALTV